MNRPAAVALAVCVAHRAGAQSGPTVANEVIGVFPQADALHLRLHQHPELSGQERETAATIATELRQLGFDVASGVGGTGIVGLLRNGAGPTVMLRTELDAPGDGGLRERLFALVNDPALSERVGLALESALGAERVGDGQPEMVSEDFSEFQLAGIPTMMLRVAAVEPSAYEAAMKSGAPVPSLHSSSFAPDRQPTIKSAIEAEVVALRALLKQ